MDLSIINITVCNNRCWPKSVLFVATAKSEWEFTYLNFVLQWLMTKRLMFKCANFLKGRRLTGAIATSFFESLQKPEEHFKAIDFLTKKANP
jgi:hypothetical protein